MTRQTQQRIDKAISKELTRLRRIVGICLAWLPSHIDFLLQGPPVGGVVGETDLAILVIDMQMEFIAALRPGSAKPLIKAQRSLLREAKKWDIPIITVEYFGSRSTVADLRRPLRKNTRHRRVLKGSECGFCGTGLASQLKRMGVRHVLVTGINARACVSATVRCAMRKGFEVYSGSTLLSDVAQTPSDGDFQKLGSGVRHADSLAEVLTVTRKVPRKPLAFAEACAHG